MKISKITFIAFFAAMIITPTSASAKSKNDSLALKSNVIEYVSGGSDILISYPQLQVPGSSTILLQTLAKNINQDACRMVAESAVLNQTDSAALIASKRVYSPEMLEMFVLKQSHISENEQGALSNSAYELYSEWAAYANEHIVSVFQKVSMYNGGANPATHAKINNYLTSNGEKFSFSNIIEDKEGFMDAVVKYFCKERRLSKKSLKIQTGLKYELADLPMPSSIGICKKGIVSVYESGEIASQKAGTISVIIPFRAMDDILDPKFFKIKSINAGIKTYNEKTKKYTK